jgi:hypothetical protein
MKALLIVALIAGVLPAGARAGCSAPQPAADPPSGASSTREEMLAAQKAIKAYNTAVQGYADCLQKSGGDIGKADDALVTLQKLADKFNVELRIFKQKSGA